METGTSKKSYPNLRPGTLTRGRSTFLTRTATDQAGELLRRSSLPPDIEERFSSEHENSHQVSATPSFQVSASSIDGAKDSDQTYETNRACQSGQKKSAGQAADTEAQNGDRKRAVTSSSTLRPIGGTGKLNTFAGVFVPTSLNVLSILMFIRFGFILGQTGLLGMLGLLVTAYAINIVTTMSISAIASNGTVRGGGAYYLISRSLGPEFGGSIGVVSYLGFVLNTGMNAVGLVDCLVYNFGAGSGIWSEFLPDQAWWPYLWATCVVILCVAVCLAGSAIFARASNALLLILLIATFSIPISAGIVKPFRRAAHLKQYTNFTGLNATTFHANLLPQFTKGAAGSQVKGRETWSDMFGILFPATGGIFAGASMSGDLQNPSKSIPRGTLYGIALTFVSYALVIIAMAASITRNTFYRNVNCVQDVNLSGVLILLGEVATTLFSVLMGIIGPAKQLQAIARDGILPGLGIFGRGTKKNDDPIYAILVTWAITQVTILFDINSIAALVTMSYLLMNFSLHLACLLLKTSSAPNFRPSFRFFNAWTALAGALLSVATMFFVEPATAGASIAVLVLVFAVIHYTTPPKAWGSDVTSGLVYHQVRKYLLRLKTESVKYWRPQILLFVNDPRRGYKLVKFANSLKKGGLFILGHVIVTENFGDSVVEAKKQRTAWTQYIDYIKIKAFINVVVSPSMEWGTRNLVLSAGLGGMRPNIVMMGFFNLKQFREEQPLIDIPSPPLERIGTLRRRRMSTDQVKGALPTDQCYVEKRTDLQSYVLTLEDLVLKLKMNVALATGFDDLELPTKGEEQTKKYIDLWPIQMSAEFQPEEGKPGAGGITTTNFDTYTLILQLGCILNTVPAWKRAYKLRVAVFVEYETDVGEEKERVSSLLENLRIQAEVLVYYLASGQSGCYKHIVNGEDVEEEIEKQVQGVLEDEGWWRDLQQLRGKVKSGDMSTYDALSVAEGIDWPVASLPNQRERSTVRYEGLQKLLKGRRGSFGNLSSMGIVPSMRTHRLDDDLISRHASHASDHSDLEHSDSDADDEFDERYSDEESDGDFSGYDASQDDTKAHSSPSRKADSAPRSRLSSKKSSRRTSPSSNKRRPTRPSQPRDRFEESLVDFQAGINSADSERGRSVHSDDNDQGSMKVSPEAHAEDDRSSTVSKTGTASPSFIAEPIPESRIAEQEGQGPSIAFADIPHPKHKTNLRQLESDMASRSIYNRSQAGTSPARSASGYPAGGSVPLSFNDLPCRAQHLILNDLISQNSQDTAVIFTTLPAPVEGTWKSESGSLSYITDLEVLTQGLGPVLMVHSNSMTVTTNL